MDAAELAQRFTDSLRLHDVMDAEPDLDLQESESAANPFNAAAPVIRAQAAGYAIRQLEWFVNQQPARELLENEENMALLLALLIVAGDMGDVQLHTGSIVFGAVMNDLTEVTIEVAAGRGDFNIEFLISWNETGPHPAWYNGAPDSVPHSIEIHRQLALIRDDSLSGQPSASDRKTRRAGLASLDLLVLSYELLEAGRDPFGLAKRALGDLQRSVYEQMVP